MLYFSYTPATPITAETDFSVMLIATTGSPITYITATPGASFTASPNIILGTGSLFLHSSASLAGVPSTILSVGSTSTVYIAVATGSSSTRFTIAVSVTTRLSMRNIANQTLIMPATPANTIQMVTWSFTMNNLFNTREYMSFAVSYATNQLASALSSSGPINQPAIIFSHDEWISENNNARATPDPTLTLNWTMIAKSPIRTGAFAVLDRVQSYPRNNLRTAYFSFMVYIPYAVPAGAAFTISNINPDALIQRANDNGGANFIKTLMPLSNGAATVSGSLSLGSCTGFNIGLPPASTMSPVTVTMTTTSGQAYIYAVESAEFAGAIGVNQYTGDPTVPTGSGWAVDGYWASNAYWVGRNSYLVTPFPMMGANEGTTNTLQFQYTSANNSWFTVVAFAPRGTTTSYTLTVTGPATPLLVAPSNTTAVVPPSSSSSSSLSGGAIAGIVIGSLVGAGLLVGLACCLLMGARKGKGKDYGKDEDVARNTAGYSQSQDEVSQSRPEVEMEDVQNTGEEETHA